MLKIHCNCCYSIFCCKNLDFDYGALWHQSMVKHFIQVSGKDLDVYLNPTYCIKV